MISLPWPFKPLVVGSSPTPLISTKEVIAFLEIPKKFCAWIVPNSSILAFVEFLGNRCVMLACDFGAMSEPTIDHVLGVVLSKVGGAAPSKRVEGDAFALEFGAFQDTLEILHGATVGDAAADQARTLRRRVEIPQQLITRQPVQLGDSGFGFCGLMPGRIGDLDLVGLPIQIGPGAS